MKKISLITLLLFFAGMTNAQPLTGSFTDCNNQTEDIQATLGTGYSGIKDQEIKNDIEWNIQAGRLSVENKSGEVIQLRILDLKGSLLNEFQVNSGTNSINLGDLKNSIYLIQFQSEKGVYAEKVLVQ
ncbi:MAG: hypothetical protein CMP59_05040 [Flavobacteriales bacterium]|nr:hypothetical protein [Flavobacteriales bacterium]|tara:strand:- start:91 stop:474 length:384 start_codon:yes stop_codon:yes gene_type:complete